MSRTRFERFASVLDTNPILQFLVAFTVILAVKWQTLPEPPAWDAAMGLFPAALTLSENNFNLLELLAMPGFLEGGPNVYGTSPVTLVTAIVLRVTGGGGTDSFVMIHLLHFAVAAYALVVLWDLAKPVFGRVSASLFCLAALLFPIFSAQVGYMYFEVPLFLCAVSAIRAWTDQRFWPAVLWATAAFSVKHAGIIVPAALVIATLLEHREGRDKVRRMALILTPLALLVAAGLLLERAAGPGANPLPALTLGQVLHLMPDVVNHYFLNVPDLWAFYGVFIAALLVFGPEVFRTLRRPPVPIAAQDPEDRGSLVLAYTGMLIVLFILLFAFVLPVFARFLYLLPRYSVLIAPFLLLWFGVAFKRLVSTRLPPAAVVLGYSRTMTVLFVLVVALALQPFFKFPFVWSRYGVMITPVLLLWLGYSFRRVLSTRPQLATAACFLLLSAFFAVNTNGVLYPSEEDPEVPGNAPALTERSNAYRRLLALEIQAVRAVKELPDDVPVYYGSYEHFLLNYPGLGFVEAPLSNGHNLNVEPLEELIRQPMPGCVYALYNTRWDGGEHIRRLIAYADADEDLSSEIIQEFRDGRYVITLYRIQKAGVVCPR